MQYVTQTHNMEKLILSKFPKLVELKKIGGHKVYHLEGDAYKHTLLVMNSAKKRNCPQWFIKVCALHDLGKLYTSIRHGENDWTYPNHSVSGAEHLNEFVSENDTFFPVYKWFIENHIKPLFWKTIQDSNNITPIPQGFEQYCTIKNLLILAVCDVEGSISAFENPKKDELLALIREIESL